MTKKEYLKLSIKYKLYRDIKWIASCFSIVKYKEENKSNEIGDLIFNPWGIDTVNEKKEIEKIEHDTKDNKPLFTLKEIVELDSSMVEGVKDKTKTTIGNLLVNLICLVDSFGSTIPYINKRVFVKDIDKLVAPILTNTPLDNLGKIDKEAKRDPKLIYVDQYLKFKDSLQFISNLSMLVSEAATMNTIVPPPGLTKKKKELVEKYKGKLNTVSGFNDFKKELVAFDEEYLKKDGTYGKFMAGKNKSAREKMFLTLGAEQGFKKANDMQPVIPSLYEGWSTDSDDLINMFNELRVGSYYRGIDVINGGIVSKTFLRAGNNFKIIDGDCKTKLTIGKKYTEKNISNLLGRNIVADKGYTMVDQDNIKSFTNKKVRVRSPMFCKLKGDRICRVCSGENLFKFPEGIAISLTEISNIILAASFKKMHNTTVNTQELDLEKIIN